MPIAVLSALLATAATSAPDAASQQREMLQCVGLLRAAAETMRGAQGDSADARSLTLSASAAEERYRRQAEADGVSRLQIEIVLAAERDARRTGSPEQLRNCLAQKAAGLAR